MVGPTDMPASKNLHLTGVITTYSKRLLAFIRKRVQSDADAEDILQDVYYQLTTYTQPIEQITAWLFRVARNKITDNRRKHRPELIEEVYSDADQESLADWSEFFFDSSDTPETAFLRNLFWETLQEALDELPQEQREVFVLHEMEGIPFKVIAEQTGATVNTLLSRKRYAVLHLRERLQTLRDEILNK